MKDIIQYLTEDKYNDYIDKATQLFIDIVNKFVDWDSCSKGYMFKFDSTITKKNMENIYDELCKHKDILATHELDFDWINKEFLIVNIFKEGQFKISCNKKDKYYVYLMNRAKTYYEKNIM